MEKQIKHLKTILKSEQFVVTGSYALKLLGFKSVSTSGDLDIILVNPPEETKELLARLQNDNPAKTKPTENSSVQFIFMLDSIKVDVFILNKKEQGVLHLTDYDIANLHHIVAAKKSYNRIKDFLQLRNLSLELFNKKDFFDYIDSLSPEQISNQSFNHKY
jgi:hypothetical protein